jgi:hypothetical protein
MRGAALGFLGVAAAGRNDLAALEEGVSETVTAFQQAARIVAQVDDEALQLVADLRCRLRFPSSGLRWSAR